MYYFSYGLNMQRGEIETRLGSVTNLGIGILDQYRLKFNKRSIDGGAKTNIVSDINSQVMGVVYELSQEQIDVLDKVEEGYNRIKLNVKLDGNLSEVEIYIAQEDRIDNNLAPNREYLGKLIQVSKERELPRRYIEDLQTIATEKDQIISEGVALAIIDTVVASIPPLALAWGLSKTLFGASLQLRQKKALEWVEMIKDNPDIFTEQILRSEFFQDGFVVAIEQYIKERNVEKRKIMREIFLGFAKSNNFEEFRLERMFQTVSNISPDTIKYLRFLDTKIIPTMMGEIEPQVDGSDAQNLTKEWWTKHQKEQEPISKFINSWVSDNFNPNNQKTKDRYNYNEKTDKYDISLQEIFDIEQNELNKMREAIGELVSLGLFRVIVEGGGGIVSSANIAHAFTMLGVEFLEYIRD